MSGFRLLRTGILVAPVWMLGVGNLARVEAAVSYTAAGQMVSETFDTLANSPLNSTPTWTNGTTLPGWYVGTSTGGTIGSYKVFNGSGASQNVLMSLGTTGDSDRALGYQTGTGGTSIHYGLRLVNNTGTVLHDFSLQYKGEQWRVVDTPVDSLVFDYQVFASGAGSLTTGSGWTAIDSLRFNSPHYHSDAANNRVLDGNLAANSATLSGTATGLHWLPGRELWLRWTDLAQNGSSQNVYQMMALDDVQFTTPEATLREVPICFDFGRSDTTTPVPGASDYLFGYYNNVTSEGTGLKISSAVNVDNATTGMSLSITNGFDGITASSSQGEVSNAAGFHQNAQQDGFFIRTSGSGEAAFRLENLDPDLVYNIELFGSRTSVASDRYTVYTIGDMEQVLDTKANTANVATFLKVAPEYNAGLDSYVIDIGVRLLLNSDTDLLGQLAIPSTNTDHGYLNALRVTPVPEPGTPLLLLMAAAGLALFRWRW